MHQLVFLLLFLFLPDATFSAPAAGSSCNRQCGSTTVSYPFGFSGGGGDCPILLACNATTSTALLPRSTAAAPYPVLSFNVSASTFLVSLAPSCGRGVAEARAALEGAGYGVSSRTGLFLRGGCTGSGSSSNASSCNVPSGVMSAILRTAQCGGGGNDSTSSWVCVLSAPPGPGSPAAARNEGQFMDWERVDAAGCQDALTSAVYAYTPQGVPSIEFGIAEMGWWLNGSCNNSGGGNGTGTGGGQCALNATCQDVQTPSGAWGHRCTCADGMYGDGFAAGDGCHYDGATSGGKCIVNIANIPTLNGSNYRVWREKYELELALGEVDFAITSPCPTEPEDPVRGDNESDADFATRKRDHAEIRMKYDLEHRQWTLSNRKCLLVAKATIEEQIRGSIPECATATEYLEKIKSQFTGSTKATASSLIKKLVNEKYTGGSIREHILKMNTTASKLKEMNLKEDDFLIHLIFASLPKEYDTFIVNYNMQPERWGIERLISMCAQEEERIKSSQSESAHFVKDNKRKNFNNKNSKPQGKPKWDKASSSQGKKPQEPENQQSNSYGGAEKDQCKHCFKKGHYKRDCPDFLKSLLKRGVKWDENLAKRRKND